MEVNLPQKLPGDLLAATEVNQIINGINDVAERADLPNYALSDNDFLQEGTVVIDGHVVPVIKINPARIPDGGGGPVTPIEYPIISFNSTNFTVTKIGDDYTVDLSQTVKDKLANIGGGSGNTKPAAPQFSADDTANTLSATHALGTSEIVMSTNGGAYVAYAPVNVGDVARAAGYYKIKTKAASGRDESDVTDSPAFTVAGGGTPVGNAVTTSKFVGGSTQSTQSPGTLTLNADDVRIAFANTSDTSTTTLAVKSVQCSVSDSMRNYTSIGLNTANYGETYGVDNAGILIAQNGALSGKVVTGNTDKPFNFTPVSGASALIRVRAVEDTTYWRFFLETSSDTGATWTIRNTAEQGGQAGSLSDVPKTTPLYGNVHGYSGAVISDIKHTL